MGSECLVEPGVCAGVGVVDEGGEVGGEEGRGEGGGGPAQTRPHHQHAHSHARIAHSPPHSLE
jgi:hypothetical protein